MKDVIEYAVILFIGTFALILGGGLGVLALMSIGFLLTY